MIKILSHFAHGVYQTELSKIPDVEFYHVVDENSELFVESDCPKNVWSEKMSQIPSNIHAINAKDVNPRDFDLILIHWHPFITSFHKLWSELPLIFLEHTWPYKDMQSEILNWKNIRHDCCTHTVFITPSSRKAWADDKNPHSSHIYHSIDIENFPKKTSYYGDQVMTTTNVFISRDWACGFSLWAHVLGIPTKKYFKNVAVYGYGNKNIGRKIAKGARSFKDILKLLQEAGVYFNPSIMSPVPMSLLEAAAVGVPIVSTKYCEPGEIFETGKHGIFSNSESELREGIKFMLDNPKKAEKMAQEARKLVKEVFNPARFHQEWTNIFKKVCNN